MVLVDNGGGNMIDFGLGPGRHGVNGVAERIDRQRQQDRVGADAVQFLQARVRGCGSSFLSTFRTPVSGVSSAAAAIKSDGKDRERQVVEPELGKPEPLGERADADLLEPGRRKAEADGAPGAGERRDRNEQPGEADRGNERDAGRAEHRGHLRANQGRYQEAKPGRRAHAEQAAGDERRPGALDRNAEHEDRQQDERGEARDADQRRREAAFRAGIRRASPESSGSWRSSRFPPRARRRAPS